MPSGPHCILSPAGAGRQSRELVDRRARTACAASRMGAVCEPFGTERDSVLGTYSITEEGETTLDAPLAAYRVEDGEVLPAR